MYLLLVHCLFERFVNMYLFSMFVNNQICCALVLLFGTNCPYECIPVNIIYYIVALLQYEYTSKEIIIYLIRS